jgi:DUF971 family protein
MTPQATQIAQARIDDERKTLEIRWRDDHGSSYPLKYLRGECPCASCRHEREEARKNPFRIVPSNRPASRNEVTAIEPVGRYGIRFHWDDGHLAGIYTFEYLREICPCEECKARRAPDAAPYVHGIHIPK